MMTLLLAMAAYAGYSLPPTLQEGYLDDPFALRLGSPPASLSLHGPAESLFPGKFRAYSEMLAQEEESHPELLRFQPFDGAFLEPGAPVLDAPTDPLIAELHLHAAPVAPPILGLDQPFEWLFPFPRPVWGGGQTFSSTSDGMPIIRPPEIDPGIVHDPGPGLAQGLLWVRPER